MTRIADLSRYDGNDVHTVDQYDGAYFNIADPMYRDKVAYCVDIGKLWGPYGWCYPGAGGSCADSLAHAVSDFGFPSPPLGYAVDYEQAGVSPVDLVNCLDRAESIGIFDRMLVYTYLYLIGSVANILRGRPLWLAYYPQNNDGSYADWYSAEARAWGAMLHQFTSSGGARDLSEVVDANLFASWIGGSVEPVPERKVIDGMWIVEKRDNGQPDQWWEPADGGVLQLTGAEAYAMLAAGIPHIDMPSIGLVGYAIRRQQVLAKSLTIGGFGGGSGGVPAPRSFDLTLTGKAAA